MALELYMVGLVTKDMNKAQEFYRRLGVAIPEGSEGQRHVGVKMKGDLTFFLNASETFSRNAPGQREITDSGRVIFEFYLPDRATVDQKHAELTGFGYQSSRPPAFEPTISVYFALVNDPDGHTIMLSAD